MIAILCPSKGRPDQLKRMIASAGNNKIYVAMDKDEATAFLHHNYKVPDNVTFIALPDLMPTAQKWNYLAELAMEDPDNKLFMLGADDMYFETEGWDAALIDHYNKLENKIHAYALQDTRDPDGTPHPIVSREWIDAMGYFVPPIFLHWFVDTWTISIAKANGVFTHFKQFRLVHDKPSDRGTIDQTHSRIRKAGWLDRDKWVNQHCQHFLDLEIDRLGDPYLHANRRKQLTA